MEREIAPSRPYQRDGEPIDAVITWVDGSDPEHRAKRMAHGGGGAVVQRDDVGGEVRYSSTGEIFYAVGSLLRFAPWLRTIWIVTDNQDPRLDEFVERNFPERTTTIAIVDHRTIFRGYKQHLPTFNSISIETMLWRIPGLADRHIYLNDDMFLASPIVPEVWFEGEQTYLYASRTCTLWGKLLRGLKHAIKGAKTFGYKDAMVNSATQLGSGHFWYFPHAPQPLRRSWYEQFFAQRPELIDHNIRHPFREGSQYSYVSLFFIEGAKQGLITTRPHRSTTLFLKPSARKSGYMARKIAEGDNNPRLLWGCINSLGETSAEEQRLFHEWICRRLNISL